MTSIPRLARMSVKYANQLPAGSSNRIRNVAIVGAGGRAGSAFTSALLSQGAHTITALTRIGSPNTLDPRIHHIKPVDYSDPSSLTSALRGQDAVLIALNARAVGVTQPLVIAAAAAAGVPWVLPNEFGFDPHDAALGDDALIEAPKRAVRKQIEEAGMSWVGLINGFWYEYSLSCGPNAFGFDLPARKVTLVDDGTGRQNTSAIPQMAEAMARLLALPVLPEAEGDEDKGATISRWRNDFCFVSSFCVSQREMLESVLRVTGDKMEDWTVVKEGHKERYEGARADLKAGKMEAFQRCFYTRVMYPGCGDFGSKYPLANELLGLKRLDLDEWTARAIKMSKSA